MPQDRVVTIPISRVDVDPELQVRIGPSGDVVENWASLIKDGHVFPPVICYYDGHHTWLADGFRRIAATRAAGEKEIKAVIRAGTKSMAIEYALTCNGRHGTPLTNDEKRRAVVMALGLEHLAKRTDRQIADHIGCVTSRMVFNIRKELAPKDEPEPERGQREAPVKRKPGVTPRSRDERRSPEDSLGNKLPPEMVAAFANPSFRKVQSLIGEIEEEAGGLGGAKGGEAVNLGEVSRYTGELRNLFIEAMPFCLCPYCKGKEAGCEECHGRGWMHEHLYFGAVPVERRWGVA